MSKIQNVDALEFDQIKNNIKNFLRAKPEFTDYDYEGSAMSILIDILAYNTHYNSLYTNMMLNESFLDSASKYSSVVSLAKSIGYTAKSVRSASAKLTVVVSDVPDSPDTLTLPKHTAFKSIKDGKEFSFYTLNTYTSPNVAGTYTFNVDVTEGFPIKNFYTVADAIDYIVPNTNADMLTLGVFVQESSTSSATRQFYRTDEILDIGPEDSVFYIKQREDLFYQIFFGDDVIGRSVQTGNVIFLDYLVSKGESGNGCSAFYYASGARGDVLYSVTTTQIASGGADAESITSIKFNAPRNYIAQNRAVTSEDYKNQILSHFPQVESVAVWGGQDNDPPQYGRVFISAKPFGRSALNAIEKNQINDFLSKKRSVVSVQQVFVDPTILEIGLDVHAYYNPLTTTKTTGELKQLVKASIDSYASTLNVFESSFRFSKLSSLIDTSDNSIVSNISKIHLVRSVTPNIGIYESYHINIGNPIYAHVGSVKSSRIRVPLFDGYVSIQNDEIGDLYIYDFTPEGLQRKSTTKVGRVNFDSGLISIENIRINSLFDPIFEFKIIPTSNDVVPTRQNILTLPPKRTTINIIADPTISGGSSNYIFSPSR